MDNSYFQESYIDIFAKWHNAPLMVQFCLPSIPLAKNAIPVWICLQDFEAERGAFKKHIPDLWKISCYICYATKMEVDVASFIFTLEVKNTSSCYM